MAVELADTQDNWNRLGAMNHRVTRLIFGFGVGFLIAFAAFKWISDPAPRAERQLEESVVIAARHHLKNTLSIGELEVVDPLATNREAGKSYVYQANDGWEVSGHYRRGEGDRWHPFLMMLDNSLMIASLKVRDKDLVDYAAADTILEAVP